jgi:hypothetical protein
VRGVKGSEPCHRGEIAGDIGVLADFISVYCREKHGDAPSRAVRAGGLLAGYLDDVGPELCDECARLLLHGAAKRALCPHDPKPGCRKCGTHCYSPGYRERIREVMRFSGMHLIRKGRLGLLKKYFF